MDSSTSPSPFFPVVVPCYNPLGIAHDTILVVLKQDYQGFELILVDDCGCSTASNYLVKKKHLLLSDSGGATNRYLAGRLPRLLPPQNLPPTINPSV